MRAPAPGERDGGYLLVEMLVVIALMGVVGGLVSDAIISSFKGQRDITARATDLNSLRQAMERTTRDMRAASEVVCPQGQLLRLVVPTAAGGSQTITWSVTAGAGGAALIETAPDAASGCSPAAGPSVTVLSNLDPSAPVFAYAAKAGYMQTTPGSVDTTDCHVLAAPDKTANQCVGSVNLDLQALLPGHPDLELTESVELRNVT